jgi:hypothetical protein
MSILDELKKTADVYLKQPEPITHGSYRCLRLSRAIRKNGTAIPLIDGIYTAQDAEDIALLDYYCAKGLVEKL